jgi:uncharacterized protein (TIGR03790 family)
MKVTRYVMGILHTPIKLLLFIGLLCYMTFSIESAYAIDFINQNTPVMVAENVAVVINENNPNSVTVGEYYLQARKVPLKNLIKIKLEPETQNLGEADFKLLRDQIYAQLSPNIQVILLVWTTPFAVGCNSITSAMTLGYDAKQCVNGCDVGTKSPYFNSESRNPSQDLHIRLSMLMPTDSVETAKALIDRGVLSEFNVQEATGYFLKTSDDARSKPREKFFPHDLFKIAAKKMTFRTIRADSIQNKKDIMFYMTGMERVPKLKTLNFLPGAIGDHLTSAGGVLRGDMQMSGLDWIEAGVTGTYGSVSEPCNFWQKFPNPEVLVKHYLAGETLIEAYWKSVYWPAQGLFIGEPLAAPYKN